MKQIMDTTHFKKAIASTFGTLAIVATIAGGALQSCTPTTEKPAREIKSLSADTTTVLIENATESPSCHISVDFKYLQPASADDTTATAINQKLEQIVFGAIYAAADPEMGSDEIMPDCTRTSDSPETLMDKAITFYLADYHKEVMPVFEEAQKGGWIEQGMMHMYNYEYGITSELKLSKDNIYNYSVVIYEYTGGAHPNTFLHWTNLNAKTGKELKLEDVLKSGYQEQLTQLIGQHLVAEINQRLETDTFTSVQELFNQGILFEEDIQIPENFLITDEGIQFLYNRYEIAAYAMGDLQVTIPYEELQENLR